MNVKSMEFLAVIEEIQKAFGVMQKHVEVYNNLLQFWLNQSQSWNMKVEHLPFGEAIFKDMKALQNAISVFNSAASLITFTSLSQKSKSHDEPQQAIELQPSPHVPSPTVEAVRVEPAPEIAEPAEYPLSPLYNFAKIQLREGDKGKCIVSTVNNDNEGLTYITVVTKETSPIFEKIRQHCLKNGTYQWIPPSNTVFGYHDVKEDQFFRAISVKNNRKFSETSIDIFLVDFGEYISMSANDPFYKLSGIFSNLPAQARLVKILKIDDEPFEDLRTIPDKERWNYVVVGVSEEVIYVNFYSETDQTTDESVSGDLENCVLKPPADFASDSSPADNMIEKEDFNFLGASSGHNVDQQRAENDASIEEGTSNALKAVFGFVPRDDNEYCKFFDPKTLGCYKGANCRKIHLPKDETGWTEDTTPVKTSIPKAPLPKVGHELYGMVTCVVNPEICYVHFDTNAVFNLFMINDHIHKLAERGELRPLRKKPDKYELVTALFNGHWYRAQIVDFHIEKTFRVRYVDYGNTENVTIEELREWCSRYDHIPYFAQRIRIANVSTIDHKIVQATKHLQKVLMEGNAVGLRKIMMKIISVDSDIEITIADADGFDVGESMVALELVNYRQV